MSKAWLCIDEEWCRPVVVFADTRGKAKSCFLRRDTVGYFNFCIIKPRRIKELDYLDRPNGYIMDWHKDEDRLPMVRDGGFNCREVYIEFCEECCAKKWCSKYKKEERKNFESDEM